jgi:hypothetical protein
VVSVRAQSPFYEWSVVAKKGDQTSVGETIEGIDPEVSVNENGLVVFVGNFKGGSDVIAGTGRTNLQNLTWSVSRNRLANYDFPQINNLNRVVVRELREGRSAIMWMDVAAPGNRVIVADANYGASPFVQVTLPVLANQNPNQPPFIGFIGRGEYDDVDQITPFNYLINDSGRRNQQDLVANLSGRQLAHLRSMAAAAERRRFVIQYGISETDGRVVVWSDSENLGLWEGKALASTQSDDDPWLALGRIPSISDSGTWVAFGGVHPTQGPGIYLAVLDPGLGFTQEPIRIMGTNDLITYNGAGDPIYFREFEFRNNRVAILHQSLGAPGLEDDCLTLTFVATPTEASRPNPAAPDHRLQFTGESGIWTLRVDIERQAQSPRSLVLVPTEAIPVIQEQTVLDNGARIVGLQLYDPLSLPFVDTLGSARIPVRGDHYLAFSAAVDTNGDGKPEENRVFRGALMDTDEDGLLDHWERIGIDMDGDGEIDLPLPEMGANPLRQDLFLELDWLNPRTEGVPRPWSYRPEAGMIDPLVQLFAQAPITNIDGSIGITLHVDAGPGRDAAGFPLSVNMGSNNHLIDGGDEINWGTGPDRHLDVVYFGLPNSIAVPGLQAADLHGIKDGFFGKRDKRARELVFKYCVLGDFVDVVRNPNGQVFVGQVSSASAQTLACLGAEFPNLAGYGVKVIQGRAAGQVRLITTNTPTRLTLNERWSEMPDSTSRFVLLAGNVGEPEDRIDPAPALSTRPGNDLVAGLASLGLNPQGGLGGAGTQFRVIAHLLGRSLGLRPGGTDLNGFKPVALYRSLMNYKQLFDFTSYPVSYAGASDHTFNDWANLKMDFYHSTRYIGNSFERSPGGIVGQSTNQPPVLPPPPPVTGDHTPPGVVITQPDGKCAQAFGLGSQLVVSAKAWDDVGLSYVMLLFDVNGDGLYSGDEEIKVGQWNAQQETFSAVFSHIAGPLGIRNVIAFAYDTSRNRGLYAAPVPAGGVPDHAQYLLNQTDSFLAQPAQVAGGQPQTKRYLNLTVPGSGRLMFTVTSTPPAPTNALQAVRMDSRVTSIRFRGQDLALQAIGTPPETAPATYCAYWQSPVGGGNLEVEVSGPAIFDASGQFLGHPAQAFTVVVLFEPEDLTAPVISITRPGPQGFVGLTQDLIVEAQVTDDYAVTNVVVEFDRNGDGDRAGAGEKVNAFLWSASTYRATLRSISGPPGPRLIRVTAVDPSGNQAQQTAFVEVKAPDTTPPSVAILSPAPASLLRLGDPLTVEVQAGDDVKLDAVRVSFDLDGDGLATGPTETVLATNSAPGVFRASFAGLTGPPGARLIQAIATDSSLNQAQVAMPVTVAGVLFPEVSLFRTNGTFPAKYSLQVDAFGPVNLPAAGHLKIVVTGTPVFRQTNQNLSRIDSNVQRIKFNGTNFNLSPQFTPPSVNPSVSTSEWDAPQSGVLSGEVSSPMEWDIWGDWNGHPAQDYTVEVLYKQVDKAGPTVEIQSPPRGTALEPGSNLTVEAIASDDVGLASLVMLFDVNGDGNTDALGESVIASNIGGNRYRAVFTNLSGAPGARRLEARATDSSLNQRSAWATYGVGGVGAAETLLAAQSGSIPPQGWGAPRTVITFDPIAIPRSGRITFRVTATPNVRQSYQNLDRYDAMVKNIKFNEQAITLNPAGNPPGSNPAVLVSVWDAPGPGALKYELLGPAVYNIWGEFDGQGGQSYQLEVLFVPGPTVTQVLPNAGSVAGRDTVKVTGSGFGANAVVLFDEVAANDVVRVSANELRCATPPGVAGPVTVRVLNSDGEGQPWNYGVPYGLFGELPQGFTYLPPQTTPLVRGQERLVTTAKGYFPRVGSEGALQATNINFTLPAGRGRLRFEVWAFPPILNPIPGPYDDPEDLSWHNQSSAVRSIVTGNGSRLSLGVASSDLSFAFGPVICDSDCLLDPNAAGAGTMTVTGPARWNAFWRQFGEFVVDSAPAQNWSVAVWFADEPVVVSLTPTNLLNWGGTRLTIRGDHFANPTQVRIGGLIAPDVKILDPQTLTCLSPAGLIGAATVEVTTQDMAVRLDHALTFSDSTPYQSIEAISRSPDQVVVRLRAIAQAVYQLQRAIDGQLSSGPWLNIGAPQPGHDGWLDLTDPAPPKAPSGCFYRVAIQP